MSALEVIAAKKKAKGTTAPTLTKKPGEGLKNGSESSPSPPALSPLQARLKAVREAKRKLTGKETRVQRAASAVKVVVTKKTSPDKKELIDDDPGSTSDSGDSQPSHAAPNISCRGEKR